MNPQQMLINALMGQQQPVFGAGPQLPQGGGQVSQQAPQQPPFAGSTPFTGYMPGQMQGIPPLQGMPFGR